MTRAVIQHCGRVRNRAGSLGWRYGSNASPTHGELLFVPMTTSNNREHYQNTALGSIPPHPPTLLGFVAAITRVLTYHAHIQASCVELPKAVMVGHQKRDTMSSCNPRARKLEQRQTMRQATVERRRNDSCGMHLFTRTIPKQQHHSQHANKPKPSARQHRC
jgi:hypothetical protein